MPRCFMFDQAGGQPFHKTAIDTLLNLLCPSPPGEALLQTRIAPVLAWARLFFPDPDTGRLSSPAQVAGGSYPGTHLLASWMPRTL